MKLNERLIEKAEIIKEEKLPAGILARVRYPIMRFGVKNANKRIYEKAVAEKVLKDTNIVEKLKTRTLFGDQEHPEKSQIKLNKDTTSHIISNIYVGEDFNKQIAGKVAGKLKETKLQDNVLYADFDILPTEAGKFINVLLEAGCMVGVSTRADGELEEKIDEASGEKYHRVIPESYAFQTTDFTGDPSTPDALPENVQKNVIDIVKKEYEAKNLDKNVAMALLEAVSLKEGKDLSEAIKIDKQHSKCKCSIGEKKCSGGCPNALDNKLPVDLIEKIKKLPESDGPIRYFDFIMEDGSRLNRVEIDSANWTTPNKIGLNEVKDILLRLKKQIILESDNIEDAVKQAHNNPIGLFWYDKESKKVNYSDYKPGSFHDHNVKDKKFVRGRLFKDKKTGKNAVIIWMEWNPPRVELSQDDINNIVKGVQDSIDGTISNVVDEKGNNLAESHSVEYKAKVLKLMAEGKTKEQAEKTLSEVIAPPSSREPEDEFPGRYQKTVTVYLNKSIGADVQVYVELEKDGSIKSTTIENIEAWNENGNAVRVTPEIQKLIQAKIDQMGLDELHERITEVNGKFEVKSKKGRNLGIYETKERARRRLRQVEFFKHPGIKESRIVDLKEAVKDMIKDLYYLRKELKDASVDPTKAQSILQQAEQTITQMIDRESVNDTNASLDLADAPDYIEDMLWDGAKADEIITGMMSSFQIDQKTAEDTYDNYVFSQQNDKWTDEEEKPSTEVVNTTAPESETETPVTNPDLGIRANELVKQGRKLGEVIFTLMKEFGIGYGDAYDAFYDAGGVDPVAKKQPQTAEEPVEESKLVKKQVNEDAPLKIEIDPKVQDFLDLHWEEFLGELDAINQLVVKFKITDALANKYVKAMEGSKGRIELVTSNEAKVTYKGKKGKIIGQNMDKDGDGKPMKMVQIRFEDGKESWEVADDVDLKKVTKKQTKESKDKSAVATNLSEGKLNETVKLLEQKVADLTAENTKMVENYAKDMIRSTHDINNWKSISEIKADSFKTLFEAAKNTAEDKARLEESIKEIHETHKQDLRLIKNSFDAEKTQLEESHRKDLIEQYIEIKTKLMGLVLPNNLKTLFEGCKTREEVDGLIRQTQDAMREGISHYDVPKTLVVESGKPLNPERARLDKLTEAACKAMG